MQESPRRKIMKLKDKYTWKDKLFFMLLASLSFLAFIGTLIVGLVTKKWSYMYTVLMTSAIFIFAKWLATLAYQNILGSNKEQHRYKRLAVVFKAIFIYIGINFIYILPFIIVWLTVLLTTHAHLTVQVYTSSPYFSMWMLLGWFIFLVFFSLIYSLTINYDRKIGHVHKKDLNIHKTQ